MFTMINKRKNYSSTSAQGFGYFLTVGTDVFIAMALLERFVLSVA